MKSIFRTTDMVLIAVMVGTAATTYKLKHDAQDRLAEIRKLQAQIRSEEDTIEILKADWSLLVQPARLQKLTTHYGAELPLQPLDAHQMVSLSDIPMKPPEAEPDPSEKRDTVADAIRALEGLNDPITTGGIAR